MVHNEAHLSNEEIRQQYIGFGNNQPSVDDLTYLREELLTASDLRFRDDLVLFGEMSLDLATVCGSPKQSAKLLTVSRQSLEKAATQPVQTPGPQIPEVLLAHIPKFEAKFVEGEAPGVEHEQLVLQAMREVIVAANFAGYYREMNADTVHFRQAVVSHALLSRTNLHIGEMVVHSWPSLMRQRETGWDIGISSKGFLSEDHDMLTMSAKPRRKKQVSAKRMRIVTTRGNDMSLSMAMLMQREKLLLERCSQDRATMRDRQALADCSRQLDTMSSRVLGSVGFLINNAESET
jgi:hypothetical protein